MNDTSQEAPFLRGREGDGWAEGLGFGLMEAGGLGLGSMKEFIHGEKKIVNPKP